MFVSCRLGNGGYSVRISVYRAQMLGVTKAMGIFPA